MFRPAEIGAMKAGEKSSNFSLACSLLGQFLKEKGRLEDLGLDLNLHHREIARGQPETPRTMDLLPGIEDAVSDWEKRPNPSAFLPPRTGAGSLSYGRETPSSASPMTIFYGGKVLVFEDLPAVKAEEVMTLACRSLSDLSIDQQALPHRFMYPAAPYAVVSTSSSETKPAAAPESSPKLPQREQSDLPIARRASLHRFLEKRKDRINAKGPYHAPAASPARLAKEEEETRRWVAQAAPPPAAVAGGHLRP